MDRVRGNHSLFSRGVSEQEDPHPPLPVSSPELVSQGRFLRERVFVVGVFAVRMAPWSLVFFVTFEQMRKAGGLDSF